MRSPLSLESDLIAGLATPPGSSGVAVIRLSGPDLPQRLFSLLRHPRRKPLLPESFIPRSLRRLDLLDPDGDILLDQALVVYFPAPHSFTGEAQMELHCHGSPVVIARIFAVLTDLGVRMAKPGEFSRRAYHNGKMDLTQAEALMALIHASTLRAAREAARQLQGSLGVSVMHIREALLDILAQVEADLDFSDEEIDPADDDSLRQHLATVHTDLEKLVRGAAWGQRLQNGFELVIAGQPNVGKSSLYNLLIGQNKAIVTAIPGTTRDLNEHRIEVQGMPLLLVDTAGLRMTEALVEREGIRRAKARIAQADGVLLLYDAKEGLADTEQQLAYELGPERLILVANKIDLYPNIPLPRLPKEFSDYHSLTFSCFNHAGLEGLLSTIHTFFMHDPCGEEGTIIMVSRQKEAIQRSKESVQEALILLECATTPKEILAMVLRTALEAMGDVAGETHHEHLLDHIFSTFCIGK